MLNWWMLLGSVVTWAMLWHAADAGAVVVVGMAGMSMRIAVSVAVIAWRRAAAEGAGFPRALADTVVAWLPHPAVALAFAICAAGARGSQRWIEPVHGPVVHVGAGAVLGVSLLAIIALADPAFVRAIVSFRRTLDKAKSE
jgi:hypothetical protein